MAKLKKMEKKLKKNLLAKYYSRVIFYSLIPQIGWASDSKCLHNCFQMTLNQKASTMLGRSQQHPFLTRLRLFSQKQLDSRSHCVPVNYSSAFCTHRHAYIFVRLEISLIVAHTIAARNQRQDEHKFNVSWGYKTPSQWQAETEFNRH